MSEGLFRIRRPQDRETAGTWMLLVLIVAAGAGLRFWGLGNIGLHGDEDVMALATRGILETGVPVIPGGMLYPRALPQLYLMALSVSAFGDSEWALTLPSALAGTLMILVGYLLARRFLTVRWSLFFAALIALLPSMIVLSQTARMYVFYVAAIMLLGVAIFRWERTEAPRDWALALGAYGIALSFHSLAVFASLLFLYPGILKRSRRLLAWGVAGFTTGGLGYKLVADWSSAQYPPLVEAEPGAPGAPPESLAYAAGPLELALGGAFVLLAAAIAWFASRTRPDPASRLWLAAAAALLATAGAAAALVQFHLAWLAWFFGAIFFVRSGRTVLVPAGVGVLLLALLAWHGWATWQAPEVRSLYDFGEALLGWPKPLSYLTFATFAPVAVAAYVLLFLYFAAGFARGRALPDHVLLFLVTVLAPLFIIAVLEDYFIPPRYVVGVLPFFSLALLAGAHDVLAGFAGRSRPRLALVHGAAAALLLVAFVSPSELRYNVNPQYADFRHLSDHRGVDHRGAAEYVISRGSPEEDVVIVLDSQPHGYYLPDRMDYYMRSLHAGRNSTVMRDGRLHELYTGTPQIASGEELEKIVRDGDYDEILVVGSGELEKTLPRHMGKGIWETMQALGFEQAWIGRDGATPVWRYTRPEATAAAADERGGSEPP